MAANCCWNIHSKFNRVWILLDTIWCHVYFLKFIYYIVSVILLYVLCKGTGYWEQSLSKSKCTYELDYIMKHVDVTGNLLHYVLSCLYVCMKSNEIYKM